MVLTALATTLAATLAATLATAQQIQCHAFRYDDTRRVELPLTAQSQGDRQTFEYSEAEAGIEVSAEYRLGDAWARFNIQTSQSGSAGDVIFKPVNGRHLAELFYVSFSPKFMIRLECSR
jgi:hypothetical protein